MAIAKRARDMTPSSADELLYFAAKSNEEHNRLGFNKDLFKRESTEKIPTWAKQIMRKDPEDRLPKEIHDLQALLRTVEGFVLFSGNLQLETCRLVQYERYGPNRVVLKEGHYANAFYIVFSGSLFINRYEHDSVTSQKHLSTVAIRQRGSWFGERALISDAHRSETVVTREPVELLSIDKRNFKTQLTAFESEMMLKCQFARETQLFAEWETESLEELLFKSHVIEYQIGKLIDKDGSMSESLYIIMEGRCKVLRKVNIQKLRQRVEAQRAKAAINSWIKTNPMPPVCTRQVGPQHQAGHQVRRSSVVPFRKQSQFEGLHKRKTTLRFFAPYNDDEDERAVFIHVGNLTAKDAFDLSWLGSSGPLPTLILVSEGAKALRVPKAPFSNQLTDHTREIAKKCIISFIPEGELYDACTRYKEWQKFRETVLSDKISSQLERGVFRTERAAEATMDSMITTAMTPVEVPRYAHSRRSQEQRKPTSSKASMMSTAMMSHFTMSTTSNRN